MVSMLARLQSKFVTSRQTLPSARELEHCVQRRMFTVLTTIIVVILSIYCVIYVVQGNHRMAWLNLTGCAIGIACTFIGHRTQNFAWPMRVMMVSVFALLTVATLEQGPTLPASGWWLSIVPFILAGAGLYYLAIAAVFAFLAIVSWMHFGNVQATTVVEPWRHYAAVVGSETLALLIISVAMRTRTSIAEALDAARSAAQEAAAIKTGFLAHMSHEIRTPLTGIIGVAEVLASQDLSDKQREQLLALQRQSAGTLLALVNDVLDFAKLEAGKVGLEALPVDLRELAFESNEMFSMQAFDKGVELSSSCSRDVPLRCIGDPLRLRQIVHNLVGNAVKFTDRGEVHLDVGLAPADDTRPTPPGHHWIRIAVSDTGPGIPDDQRIHLFKPFIQLDGSVTRRFGGSGLGLSISQDLAHLMGGHIEVDSRVGHGSVFALLVPLRAESDPVEQAAPSLRPDVLVATASPGVSRHIGSLLSHIGVAPSYLTRLPNASELASCRVLLVDAPLLPRTDPSAWLAEQAQAGLHVAVLTPLGADAVVGAPEGVHLVYKPVRPEALSSVLPNADAVPHSVPVDPSPSPAPVPLSRLRVLVAEDNPVNHVVIQAMLTELGIVSTMADNGRAALETALTGLFDVVLMDVHMPEMDGLSATRELRAREKQLLKRPLHVIAMTARTEHDDEIACIAAGMDNFLPKPFGLGNLRRCLELAAARQAAL